MSRLHRLPGPCLTGGPTAITPQPGQPGHDFCRCRQMRFLARYRPFLFKPPGFLRGAGRLPTAGKSGVESQKGTCRPGWGLLAEDESRERTVKGRKCARNPKGGLSGVKERPPNPVEPSRIYRRYQRHRWRSIIITMGGLPPKIHGTPIGYSQGGCRPGGYLTLPNAAAYYTANSSCRTAAITGRKERHNGLYV